MMSMSCADVTWRTIGHVRILNESPFGKYVTSNDIVHASLVGSTRPLTASHNESRVPARRNPYAARMTFFSASSIPSFRSSLHASSDSHNCLRPCSEHFCREGGFGAFYVSVSAGRSCALPTGPTAAFTFAGFSNSLSHFRQGSVANVCSRAFGYRLRAPHRVQGTN